MPVVIDVESRKEGDRKIAAAVYVGVDEPDGPFRVSTQPERQTLRIPRGMVVDHRPAKRRLRLDRVDVSDQFTLLIDGVDIMDIADG